MARGIVFAIDEDRSCDILVGFLVGRIAYLPLGSLRQLVLTMDHVETCLEILQGLENLQMQIVRICQRHVHR
jgi:hypothetical protein